MDAAAAAGSGMISGNLRIWGFLRWKQRFFELDSAELRLWKGEAAEGEPALVLPVERLHLTVDTEKDNSFTLDDGAALFQMKASSREARDELQAAVKRAQEGHGDLAELRRLRANYTERVGKYALGELLGQGGFAKVKSGINWETGERVAAKIMPAHIAQDPQHKKEIVAMGSLNHPNVVKLLDIVYHPASVSAPGRIFLILELATGGELFSKVVDAGYLSERRARFYFRQLLQGVAYCHSHSLCHRDLKLENMLLDATGQTLKITDFGFAKNISLSGGGAEAKTILGTAVYVAPEVLDGKTYDGFKTDIWACGVVLFTMCVGRYPFDYGYHGGVGPSNPRNNMELMKRLQRAEYTLPDTASKELADFLALMIQPDPTKRLGAEEALKHPWVLADDQTEEQVDGLLRQMSSGPIATISDGESPELWMGKLEACRQAADAARDVTLTGGASAVRLAEEGVPGEAGASAPEPSAVTFDDSDSD